MNTQLDTSAAESLFSCDCGSSRFFVFGPYTDADELGLRRVYTCARCGEQMRLYQTSDKWRAARDASP